MARKVRQTAYGLERLRGYPRPSPPQGKIQPPSKAGDQATGKAMTGETLINISGGIVIGAAALTALYVATNWAPERTVAQLRARWGRPPSVFVNVAGMTVHLRDEGPRDDPSPIVLLHPTVSSLHTWDGWVEVLKSQRRVIRFDLRGFGLTGPSPDGTYGFDEDVRLVIAVLDHLGIERCVLGGNSLGGGISWRTALAHPSRVEKLILVDAEGYATTPTSMPLAFHFAGMPIHSWFVRNTFPRGLVEQGLRNVYGDPRKVTKEMMVRTRELTECSGNRHALIQRGRQWKRQAKEAAEARRIAELKLPTLIIWGGRDRLIPPDTAERFHHDIAGSTLVVFKDLGHMPQEEDPLRTVAAVKQFLGLEQASV
jgi:pimeloyl-ACP methyl ester carboxylesterase